MHLDHLLHATTTFGEIQAGPIIACTTELRSPVGPVAYDCMQLTVVRSGSAYVFSEFGRTKVETGDAILLCPNTLFGCEPDDEVAITTAYVDSDFLTDLVFWNHASYLTDRLQTKEYLEDRYVESAQLLRLGRSGITELESWLDELVSLSARGEMESRFFRMLALLFSIFDVAAPLIEVTDTPISNRSLAVRPPLPRYRQYHPLRPDALLAKDLLRSSLQSRWTLGTLAEEVHLSPSQLSRVFFHSFGRTPLSYLTMLRVEELARLLRSTVMPIGEASRQVGWSDPSYAARMFRRHVGMTPRAYRAMCREQARPAK